MIVQIDIPDLSNWTAGFTRYYSGLIFIGNRPENATVHALINGYIRLVESAVRLYEQARRSIHLGWNTHDKIMLGAFNDASTAFEAAITNMYRAATFMVRLRKSTEVDAAFKEALGERPDFVRQIDQLRRLRRAIHHLDEDILNGRVPDGTPTYLMATGEIEKRSDGQDLKKIDRLQIGETSITFERIASWLTDMLQCARRIEAHDWKRPGPGLKAG